MRYFTVLLAIVLLLFNIVSANSVTLYNDDDQLRFMCSTPDTYFYNHWIDAYGAQTVFLDEGWNGTIHAVYAGQNCEDPRVIGEFKFQGAYGLTYFDVSAVDNPYDNNGLKFITPAVDASKISGCWAFPCDGAYIHSGDHQTKSTPETDLHMLFTKD